MQKSFACFLPAAPDKRLRLIAAFPDAGVFQTDPTAQDRNYFWAALVEGISIGGGAGATYTTSPGRV